MRWKATSKYSAISEDGKWHVAKFVVGEQEKILLWGPEGLVPQAFQSTQAAAQHAADRTSAAARPIAATGS